MNEWATAVFSFCRLLTMSSLLEIKSSVLRQVQACPSFRRKTEEEPGSASTDLQEPATGAWWVPHIPERAWEGLNPRLWGTLWTFCSAPRCALSSVGYWLVLGGVAHAVNPELQGGSADL